MRANRSFAQLVVSAFTFWGLPASTCVCACMCVCDYDYVVLPVVWLGSENFALHSGHAAHALINLPFVCGLQCQASWKGKGSWKGTGDCITPPTPTAPHTHANFLPFAAQRVWKCNQIAAVAIFTRPKHSNGKWVYYVCGLSACPTVVQWMWARRLP